MSLVDALLFVSLQDGNPRKPLAAWELSICYYSGFGVDKDWAKSCHYLAVAAVAGHVTSRALFSRLHEAAGIDYSTTLEPLQSTDSRFPGYSALVGKWLLDAASVGFSQSLVSVKNSGQEEIRNMYDACIRQFRASLGSPHFEISGLGEKLSAALVSGDVAGLLALLEEHGDLKNAQDSDGNSVLALAAKFGFFEMLKALLDLPGVDASIHNLEEQTPLHFLAIYDDDRIQDIVPQMVTRGADISHEALPIRYGADVPDLALNTRGSSVLTAILRNNMRLLTALLEAGHLEQSVSLCRICEGGSRYRRTLATSIAIHNFEAVEVLLEHLRMHDVAIISEIGMIRVWFNRELVPLQSAVFQGAALGLDLPESFLRAINYGAISRDALCRTLDVLLPPGSTPTVQSYKLLQSATAANSVDAVDHILTSISVVGTTPAIPWWLDISQPHLQFVLTSPLFISIKYGFREIFQRLWLTNNRLLDDSLSVKCTVWECRQCPWSKKVHEVNLSHMALSAVATASHMDTFFT